MPGLVRITEVSPRDGLQNEAAIISTPDKARLVELLCASRVDEIEVSSFVSPAWVPQLGDAQQLFAMLARSAPMSRPVFSALVPNERGLAAALETNRLAATASTFAGAAGGAAAPPAPLIAKVSVFTAASETFARKNTNASIAETLERFRPVVSRAHDAGLLVRAYLSCVIACPFEGPIAPETVAAWSDRLLALGVDELDLGDTIGAATPQSTQALLRAVARVTPLAQAPQSSACTPAAPGLTLHLHDTRGLAADCARVALDLGVRSFDSSAAGLGGCPYASKALPDGGVQRAPGNIATDLLVRTIHAAGFQTSVHLPALDAAAAFARALVAPRPAGTSSAAAGPARTGGGA